MKDERILLAHGSGGKLSHELVARVMVPAFANAASGNNMRLILRVTPFTSTVASMSCMSVILAGTAKHISFTPFSCHYCLSQSQTAIIGRHLAVQ